MTPTLPVKIFCPRCGAELVLFTDRIPSHHVPEWTRTFVRIPGDDVGRHFFDYRERCTLKNALFKLEVRS